MGIEEFLLDRAYKEGFEIGYKKGFEIGEREVNEELAIRMKENNLSIKLIANFTGLSVKEIKNLFQRSGNKFTSPNTPANSMVY